MTNVRTRRLAQFAVTVCASLLVATGCNQERREVVAGTVTYQGIPVPRGTVYFEPSDGAVGPMGTAEIVDGRFRTDEGKGPFAGRLLVRVEFWLATTNPPTPSSPVPDDGNGKSNAWLTTYQSTVDIAPGGNTECAIDIPASVKPGAGF